MDHLQATVIRAMLQKEGWHAFQDIVSEDVLNNTNARTLLRHIRGLHEGTVNDITLEGLALDIQASYPDGTARRDELLEIVGMLDAVDAPDMGILSRHVRKFVQREMLENAARYVAAHTGSDDLDVAHVADLVNRAVDIGSGIDANVLDFSTAALPGDQDERTLVTGLGLSDELDDALAGGVGAGELLVYLAPPARGKTSYLWASACHAAASGLGVLGITLEISAQKCVRRVDQWLTKLTSTELVANHRYVRNRRRELPGNIWVKDWSYQRTTVDDIKALVTRMRQRGQQVDYLMIDYMELMRPVHYNRNAERHNWSQIAQDLRALGVDLQVPVVTAWQVNRAGSDNHILSERDVSECWDVIKHADIILGLNQDAREREFNLMRVNVIKQRESTQRPQVYLHSDLNRMNIRPYEEEPDQDTTVSVGDSKEASDEADDLRSRD